ncbi:MAG: hypothetical protein K2G69_07005 [Muribaculaceae bacterium]|nr:hypothetical protein [Muribaculaceae bacterium]
MTDPADKRIMEISGATPSECSCDRCKNLCRTPCLGTPSDIERLIQAGYASRLAPTVWLVGKLTGVTDSPIQMIQPRLEANGWCTFRRDDGLCELHGKGLKPLEGRLASCRPKSKDWTIEKDFTWLIAKEWLPLQHLFPQSKLE